MSAGEASGELAGGGERSVVFGSVAGVADRTGDQGMSETIREPQRHVPVVADVDVCVVGGGCTGVFAAVAAVRQGVSAAVIESNGFFGGVATGGLVNIWHGLKDTVGQRPIIGGLTAHVLERLGRREAVQTGSGPNAAYRLNTEELKIELDELITEHRVRPMLHTRFGAPVVEDGVVSAVIVEDKTGRRAVRARMFIDATGDGDLIARAGLPHTVWGDLQPPTTCARIRGIAAPGVGARIRQTVFADKYRGRIPLGFMWEAPVCGHPDELMVAGTRVPEADCSDADSLTAAEMEGRRQVRAIMDIIRDEIDDCRGATLSVLPAAIGIRETRHASCLHTLTEQEVLHGVRFDDAIANGSYRVDVHHSSKGGLTFRYLDGREEYVVPGEPRVDGRWREPIEQDPTFYQIPYRSLVPKGARNVLVAGRPIDADRGGYGAIRVMVNCNQTGEAAGTAAALALADDVPVDEVDTGKLRAELAEHGAIII